MVVRLNPALENIWDSQRVCTYLNLAAESKLNFVFEGNI